MTERRKALITGASRGIGRAICVKLASEGTDIVFSYRSGDEAASETVNLCREYGIEIHAIKADVSNSEECERLIKEAVDLLGGRIDILINNAGIKPENIDYINAHGTSTKLNDKGETNAIKKAFGEHAYKLAVSSTKSMTGHMLGASGAVEAIISALAVKDNIIQPTINYQVPDDDCDLDIVPNKARESRVDYSMSNSLRFGGHNASIVLRKVV